MVNLVFKKQEAILNLKPILKKSTKRKKISRKEV